METTRLSTKGQIILPQAIRMARAWTPGTQFTVEETPDGVLLRPAARFPETKLEDVAGCLQSGRKTTTVTAMSGVAGNEVRRRRGRGRY